MLSNLISTARTRATVIGLVLIVLWARPAAAQEWPFYFADWSIEIYKAEGLEPEDPHWMHLHRGHETAAESSAVTLGVRIYGGSRASGRTLEPAQSGIDLRYTVHGVPVSDWLPPASGFRFTLRVDNPALNGLTDGFHDISVEVRGARAPTFKPHRVFLHMTRGRPVSTIVPLINGVNGYSGSGDFGPSVVYVDAATRRFTGYPMNPAVTPWQTRPYESDLYLELMAPTGSNGAGAQLWWEDPPHPGIPFARAITPNFGQDHRGLRVGESHERFPFKDGPRGVGWMSPYVTGQVDSKGGFAFAETGGPVRYLKPDGEVVTVAGWRVRPDRDPIWVIKPLERVRANMERRGQWVDGRGEFHTPLDVAIDPRDENIWYVVGYEDNCVWKIEIADMAANRVRVSVFAGDASHQPGFRDGAGRGARFNGPASLVFDPVSDALYVADQDNDAIRKVLRDGTVTTVFGGPGMADRLRGRGVRDTFDQRANRAASRFQVSATEAAQGLKPEIYMPQCIRVDSQGNLILLELGYGGIRRLNPLTGETRLVGDVYQTFGDFYRGWAWLDVDRWGNTGPKDGIYWCKSVGGEIDGETAARFNEVYAWLPPEGGRSRFLFGEDWNPYPEGWGRRLATNPPHYPWLVAVDRRGALLIGGFGAHGVSRLRARRASDPIPSNGYHPNGFDDGRWIWTSGAPWVYPGPPGGDRFASRSSALRFGWDAHNYLGFPDAWALRGNESDERLLDMFDAPAPVRNDQTARELWLAYVRANIGSPGPPVPPADADGDGLPDEWESRFGLNPASASGDDGASGDPDGDGVSNLAEFHGTTDPRISNTLHLAEGATGFFAERISIVNPNVEDAAFTVTFLTDGAAPIERSYTLEGQRRLTIAVQDIPRLAAAEVSAVVNTTRGGVVAERTMQWNAGSGAHTAKAVPRARAQWYLAEGEAGFFDTYLLFANANTEPAAVTATYLLESGATLARPYVVAAQSRTTVHANGVPGLQGKAFSTVVTSSLPITVERAMYFSTPGRMWAGGHASAALDTPAVEWFTAEGRTGPFFDLYLLIANPGTTSSAATVRYLKPDGSVVTRPYSLAPQSRTTIHVDRIPGLEDTDVSAAISASQPILVERAMYWPGSDPTRWYGAHASTGLTSTGTRWVLAEGEWGGVQQFETFVLLANASATASVATLLFMRVNRTPLTLTRVVPANGRLTVSAGEVGLSPGEQFGVLIDSTQPIAVERALYSSSSGQFWAAGSSETGTRLR